jgi:hypothetical protein
MTPAERAKQPPAKVPRDGPNLTGAELEEKLAATWGFQASITRTSAVVM